MGCNPKLLANVAGGLTVAHRNRGAPVPLPLAFETSSGRALVGGASAPRVIEAPSHRGETVRGAETPRPQGEEPSHAGRDARSRGGMPRLQALHPEPSAEACNLRARLAPAGYRPFQSPEWGA